MSKKIQEAQFMIQEISQRVFSAAVVVLWMIVVSSAFAMIWAASLNGGIGW
jgi:hypothetical protein